MQSQEEFIDILNRWSGLSSDLNFNYFKSDEDGKVPIEELQPYFLKLSQIASAFLEQEIETIVIENLTKIMEIASHIELILNDIQDFAAIEWDEEQSKSSIEHFIEQFEKWLPKLEYAVKPQLDSFRLLNIEKILSGAQIDEVKTRLKKDVVKISDLIKQMENSLEIAKNAAGVVAISDQSTIYGKDARWSSIFAKVWLTATIQLVVVVFLLMFWMILPYYTQSFLGIPVAKPTLVPNNSIDFYSYLISKSSFFALAFYLIFQTTKNYKISRHNEIVNRHRHNALSTYGLLTEAAGKDAEAKKTILLQATTCIFEHQNTGFTAPENDNHMSLIEAIVRGSANHK